MLVYKTLFKIAKHYLPSILIYVGIFFGICFIISKVGSSNDTTSFVSSKVNIAVVDRDNTDLSKDLYDYLASLHNIVSIKDDNESLQNELFYRNVDYIVIIPNGYATNLQNGSTTNLIDHVELPSSVSSTFIDQQLSHYFSTLETYLNAGFTVNEAIEQTNTTLSQSVEVSMIDTDTSEDYNLISYYFQYLPYLLICVILVGLAPILIRFRVKDIDDRIRASALTVKSKTLQLLLASGTFSLLIYLVFIGLALILFGNELFCIEGRLSLINSFLFLIVCVALTYLISISTTSINAINGIANIVGLGMSFLCGVFVPVEFMSKSVLNFAHILPAYWYIDANNTIASFKQTSGEYRSILFCYCIEIGFIILFFALGILLQKRKRS